MFIASNLFLLDQDYQLLKHFYQELLLDHSYLETYPNHGYLRAKKVPRQQVDEQFLGNPPSQEDPKQDKVHLEEKF